MQKFTLLLILISTSAALTAQPLKDGVYSLDCEPEEEVVSDTIANDANKANTMDLLGRYETNITLTVCTIKGKQKAHLTVYIYRSAIALRTFELSDSRMLTLNKKGKGKGKKIKVQISVLPEDEEGDILITGKGTFQETNSSGYKRPPFRLELDYTLCYIRPLNDEDIKLFMKQ